MVGTQGKPWENGDLYGKSPFFNGYINVYGWLVVWNMVFMNFHTVGNVLIPTDELHHYSEGLKPPTST
jgi:hypothetical protein